MEQTILKVLNNNKSITHIENCSFIGVYFGKSYKYIYKFVYTFQTSDIPIIIGIPEVWERQLIDVYIENYKEIKYIPHLESNGKLCLFDLEGILIDKNFEGLLNQTIDRLNNTLMDGIKEVNIKDFIEEFELYWTLLPDVKALKSMISPAKHTKLIKYSDNRKTVKKEKRDNYSDILKKEKNFILVSSDSESDFIVYKDMNAIRNGIYIFIDADEYIYPPDWRNKLDIDYIHNLLKHKSISKIELLEQIRKCKGDLLLVFNIKQPNAYMNIFGVIINSFDIQVLSEVPHINLYKELIPCSVRRCDKEYLLDRGGAISNLSDKKILVVGCGSIGGYLVNELVKTGIKNIMVVDDDILTEENIYRHILGMEYVREYKSKAIIDYINKNIPKVNINSIQDNIEDSIYDESVILSDYDLIISSVGNHNVNRFINEYVVANKIETPVIYMWNEVLGIGNHVAFISNKYDGCYECFFGRNDNEIIYDKTSFCEMGQSFTKKLFGCGSSFLPFSSVNSITTVITGIELIKNYFEGRISDNILISVKGDDYYFKEAGYKTSSRYKAQTNTKQKIEGKIFKKDSCLICNGN